MARRDAWSWRQQVMVGCAAVATVWLLQRTSERRAPALDGPPAATAPIERPSRGRARLQVRWLVLGAVVVTLFGTLTLHGIVGAHIGASGLREVTNGPADPRLE